MRAPEFWSGQAEGRDRAPLLQALLAPVSALYTAAGRLRIARTHPKPAGIPVICVGNATLGGAGKTPVTRALRERLGPRVHVLSRGHGGTARGPLRVNVAMTAREVGDEPLLHAQDGPSWIARDRVAGAQAIAAAGARLILMDDGFQNPTLAKNFSFLVIDAEAAFGNGRVFPAGPMREPIADALARADAIILLRVKDHVGARPPELARVHKPILTARMAPTEPVPSGPLVAFAGIARPEKFFETLRAAGAHVVEAVPYPDHHPYGEDEARWLQTLARERGARLITTEKDFMRLSASTRTDILKLKATAEFDDPATLEALLARFA